MSCDKTDGDWQLRRYHWRGRWLYRLKTQYCRRMLYRWKKLYRNAHDHWRYVRKVRVAVRHQWIAVRHKWMKIRHRYHARTQCRWGQLSSAVS